MAGENFWHKLRSRILKRQTPFSPFHWRFFLPSQPSNIQVHRYVLLHMHQDFPMILKMLAIIYNLTRWWLYFAWVATFYAYQANSKTCLEKYNIAKTKQAFDLFSLAFVYCIPPLEYYSMPLHSLPRKKWLDFAYDFQAAGWHEALCYPDAKPSQERLNNKADFEQFLVKANLPTIESLHVLEPKTEMTQDALDILPVTSFFKPAIGNRGIGCFTLKKEGEKQANLRFIWFKDTTEMPYKDLKDLNRVIRSRQYLVQPVLNNHPEFHQLFKTNRLSTIRLVTAYSDNHYEAISAVLETPLPDKPMYYWNVAIDINNGNLIKPKNDNLADNEDFKSWFKNLEDQTCPKWQNLKSICLQAHEKLPKLLTIGWDIALTPDGSLIIEGNISWSLKQHQHLTQTPLLQTRLGEIYTKFIENHPPKRNKAKSS